MSQGSRPERIAEQIRAELSNVLAREVRDPGLGFLTITRVQVTPDLQLARVYYTSLGTEDARRSTAKALARSTRFLRRQISRRLRLRRSPVLEFRFDEGVGQSERVAEILRELEPRAPQGSEPADEQPRHK